MDCKVSVDILTIFCFSDGNVSGITARGNTSIFRLLNCKL